MATNGARTLEYCIKLCGKIQYLNIVQNGKNASPCFFFFIIKLSYLLQWFNLKLKKLEVEVLETCSTHKLFHPKSLNMNEKYEMLLSGIFVWSIYCLYNVLGSIIFWGISKPILNVYDKTSIKLKNIINLE